MSSRDRAGRGETINIPALRSVIAALLDWIEEQEGADPQLGPGYFWDVVAEDRYDVHNQSPQLSIGDLDETRDWLESVCQEDSAAMPWYALAWAGDVLKALALQVRTEMEDCRMDTLGRAAELLAATPFPESSVEDERLAGILLDLLEIDGHFYGLAQIALGGQRIGGGKLSVDLEGTREALLSLVDLNPGDRRARGLGVQMVDACIGIREALSERRGDQPLSVHDGAGVEAEDDGEES